MQIARRLGKHGVTYEDMRIYIIEKVIACMIRYLSACQLGLSLPLFNVRTLIVGWPIEINVHYFGAW